MFAGARRTALAFTAKRVLSVLFLGDFQLALAFNEQTMLKAALLDSVGEKRSPLGYMKKAENVIYISKGMVRKMAKVKKNKKEEISFEQRFFMALDALESESHIDKDTLIEKIKSGIEKAIKKDYPFSENISIIIDPDTSSR